MKNNKGGNPTPRNQSTPTHITVTKLPPAENKLFDGKSGSGPVVVPSGSVPDTVSPVRRKQTQDKGNVSGDGVKSIKGGIPTPRNPATPSLTSETKNPLPENKPLDGKSGSGPVVTSGPGPVTVSPNRHKQAQGLAKRKEPTQHTPKVFSSPEAAQRARADLAKSSLKGNSQYPSVANSFSPLGKIKNISSGIIHVKPITHPQPEWAKPVEPVVSPKHTQIEYPDSDPILCMDSSSVTHSHTPVPPIVVTISDPETHTKVIPHDTPSTLVELDEVIVEWEEVTNNTGIVTPTLVDTHPETDPPLISAVLEPTTVSSCGVDSVIGYSEYVRPTSKGIHEKRKKRPLEDYSSNSTTSDSRSKINSTPQKKALVGGSGISHSDNPISDKTIRMISTELSGSVDLSPDPPSSSRETSSDTQGVQMEPVPLLTSVC